MKNDSVRSCLIELQSFLQSKVDFDPKHRIFDVSSMLYARIVQDAVLESRSCQDPCSLSIRSTDRKNTVCLLLKI